MSLDRLPDEGDRVNLHVVFHGRRVAQAAVAINSILEAAKDEMEWRDDLNRAWKASKYLLRHMDIIHELEAADEGAEPEDNGDDLPRI